MIDPIDQGIHFGVTPQGRASLFASPMMSSPTEWSTYRPRNSFGVTPQGRLTRKAPVRAEPHPTFPHGLAHNVIPYGRSTYRPRNSLGVTPQGRMARKAPVRAEPHPTFPRCLPHGLAHDVIPYGMVDLSAKEFIWVTPQGRMTRKAPVRAELTLYRHSSSSVSSDWELSSSILRRTSLMSSTSSQTSRLT